MPRITALIFAKYPQPGDVNTRMVPPLTAEEAAVLHEAALLAVCERVRSVKRFDVTLVVTPDERVDAFRKLVEPSPCSLDASRCERMPRDLVGVVADRVTQYWRQGDGDLGLRLVRATDRAFDAGADGVLLLGADSPTLPRDRLTEAIAGLTTHDAVIGPSADGGYYLLGMRRREPALFARIDWGGGEVAEQTRRRAAAAALDLRELAGWYDLDRFDDLKRAGRDLSQTDAAMLPAASALRRLIERLIERYDDGGAHPAQR